MTGSVVRSSVYQLLHSLVRESEELGRVPAGEPESRGEVDGGHRERISCVPLGSFAALPKSVSPGQPPTHLGGETDLECQIRVVRALDPQPEGLADMRPADTLIERRADPNEWPTTIFSGH